MNAALLLGLAAALGAPGQCAVEGELIHWVADYCMLTMQTDDEIAVSGCIAKELKIAFSSGCASNLHYKKSMCDIMVRNGTRAGTLEQCIEDLAFKGRTVEAGGVGN